MWGEGGGPQIYVDSFLRWIEKKFWPCWWPRRGLSLDEFVSMTWGAVEGESEMDCSISDDQYLPPVEQELGLSILPPERKERGLLLSRNRRFLAVNPSTRMAALHMSTGGGGTELVWLTARHNRVCVLWLSF